uniref:Uncharacterized protein n=1 Tax=Vespula pensylvanica TaxID=30213 RepID=A0A834PFR4_VESPE|nr:hypothetical protein H0235_001275 [Vespula pensylvanica]
MRKRCGRGMLEGVQQRIGAHEAQIDAQQREEICVHDVREGVQAAGPLSRGFLVEVLPSSPHQSVSSRANEPAGIPSSSTTTGK